ncbi:MAG: HD-GYP domain-containing protein [Planctomycetota bacterium]
MLRVDVNNAKPGMVLAMPVVNPQATNKYLLASGFELTPETIARMRKIGVRELMVNYPGLEVLNEYLSPVVRETRHRLAGRVIDVFDQTQRQAVASLPYEMYLEEMGQIVDGLVTNPASMMFIDKASAEEPVLLERSSIVAYLSVLMGLRLDWYLIKQRRQLPVQYAREVANLGVGALLHDIGILRLEPEVRDRYLETGDDRDPSWRMHTHLGFEMIRGQVEPSAAVVVLHHHQHFDGTGFPLKRGLDGRPQPLTGDKIHIFARITNVASTFAYLCRPREGEAFPAVYALAQMLRPTVIRRFDPNVLRAFLDVAPPYPPGSTVQLNDGRWAVPMNHNPADPCRPTVQLIKEPGYFEPLADQTTILQVIDLAKHDELYIAQADGRDVSRCNFKAPKLTSSNPAPATETRVH